MDFAVRRPPRLRKAARRPENVSETAITRARYFAWKDYFGRWLALALLVAGLPIMLAAVVLVRFTSAGSAIFRQRRVGLRGRVYTMYKIRTMRQDAEAGTGPVWTTCGDPRITRIGRLLRRLHIDEFPQLVNVLKGEMALIGPRPERPEFTQKLAVALPGYLDRLLVRPGITGLAQINLPPDTDLESVRRKLVLDLEYVEKGSLWLDLRILAATFFRLLALPNQFTVSALGLRRASRPAQHDSVQLELLAEEPAPPNARGALISEY